VGAADGACKTTAGLAAAVDGLAAAVDGLAAAVDGLAAAVDGSDGGRDAAVGMCKTTVGFAAAADASATCGGSGGGAEAGLNIRRAERRASASARTAAAASRLARCNASRWRGPGESERGPTTSGCASLTKSRSLSGAGAPLMPIALISPLGDGSLRIGRDRDVAAGDLRRCEPSATIAISMAQTTPAQRAPGVSSDD